MSLLSGGPLHPINQDSDITSFFCNLRELAVWPVQSISSIILELHVFTKIEQDIRFGGKLRSSLNWAHRRPWVRANSSTLGGCSHTLWAARRHGGQPVFILYQAASLDAAASQLLFHLRLHLFPASPLAHSLAPSIEAREIRQ